MFEACGYVLSLQFLEIPAVVRYYAQSSFSRVGKLFGVRSTQLTLVSRCCRSESPCSSQCCNYVVYVLIQVDCYEQGTVQRCLTLGWTSSGGTLFFSM